MKTFTYPLGKVLRASLAQQKLNCVEMLVLCFSKVFHKSDSHQFLMLLFELPLRLVPGVVNTGLCSSQEVV